MDCVGCSLECAMSCSATARSYLTCSLEIHAIFLLCSVHKWWGLRWHRSISVNATKSSCTHQHGECVAASMAATRHARPNLPSCAVAVAPSLSQRQVPRLSLVLSPDMQAGYTASTLATSQSQANHAWHHQGTTVSTYKTSTAEQANVQQLWFRDAVQQLCTVVAQHEMPPSSA